MSGSRRVRVPAAVALTVAMLLTGAQHASQAAVFARGSGNLNGGDLGVAIETGRGGHAISLVPGGQQPVSVDAGSPSLPRLVHYVSKPIPAVKVGDLAGLCNAAPSPTTGPPVLGWLYEVVGYSSSDQVVSDTRVCVPNAAPNAQPGAGAPPAVTLPVAPTIGDVWRAIVLPRPVVGVNPVTRGVTGLDTHLWSGSPQTAQVAVTLNGFRVTGTAHLVEYRFATDEGFLGASSGPGDDTRPAASHRFASKGAHTLTVSAVWEADATMVGEGGTTAVPLDIDTAVLSVTVAYPVVEVRSRLVG